MRAGIWGVVVVAAIVAAAAMWIHRPRAADESADGATYRAPRTADGKPDLNGIWQALNTANFDLQAHPARPALSLLPAPPRGGVPGLVRATPVALPDPAVRAFGAVGGVPAGLRGAQGFWGAAALGLVVAAIALVGLLAYTFDRERRMTLAAATGARAA